MIDTVNSIWRGISDLIFPSIALFKERGTNVSSVLKAANTWICVVFAIN